MRMVYIHCIEKILVLIHLARVNVLMKTTNLPRYGLHYATSAKMLIFISVLSKSGKSKSIRTGEALRKKWGFKRLKVEPQERQQQGRTQGGFGVKNPPLSLIFYKNFITCAKEIKCFAKFLFINLSTYCKYHRINLHANFKKHCKRAKK